MSLLPSVLNIFHYCVARFELATGLIVFCLSGTCCNKIAERTLQSISNSFNLSRVCFSFRHLQFRRWKKIRFIPDLSLIGI